MKKTNNFFLDCLLEQDIFNNLINDIKKTTTPKSFMCSGVVDSQKNHLVYGLSQLLNRPNLIITSSDLKAKEIYEDMKFFMSGMSDDSEIENREKVFYYPSKDIVFYYADVRSMDIFKQRFKVLKALLDNEDITIVLSIEALFDKLTPKDIFKSFIFTFNEGDKVVIEELTHNLLLSGYERRDSVDAVGQFAIRGGIIDIFTPVYDNAIRIELWDDEIDSIRLLDSMSQRSIEKINNITIFPIRELVYKEDIVKSAVEKIEAEYKKVKSDYLSKGLTEQAEHLTETIESALDKFKQEKSFSSVDKYSPYFYDEDSVYSLIDYLSPNTLVFFDEPARVSQRSENVLNEFYESIKNRITKGNMLPSQTKIIFSYEDILRKLHNYTKILFSTMNHTTKDIHVDEKYAFEVKSSGIVQNSIKMLEQDLKYFVDNDYRILMLVGARTRAERIAKELFESNFNSKYIESLDNLVFPAKTILVSKGSLSKGFEYPLIRTIVITDKDIFGMKKEVKKAKKKKKGVKIETFADLKVGDYVVHDSHGIGVFKGIEKIVVDSVNKDYLKIGYSDGGNLYVHTGQLDMLQKYIGGEEAKPKLNKLGSQDWTKAKKKAKAAIAILAKDLVELYAKRQAAVGYAYTSDTIWQKEFEELFPFEETDDQLSAIEDTKSDMESKRVMDRLICGDVGYGKTEVAIRAAFKAVQDNKQVAYLVPTTILAQQHFNTFVQRMKDYPINVQMLSRFRTPKQIRKTIEDMKNGLVDIVVGTHRILSKDIVFKDLGLVIVDEEQRFGVTHKEKLKTMRENVDVLTLTATPIPRTLHMSMTGIRDISILEDPPQQRQPIQTYVLEHDYESIRDAITRELAREGQVYYLHNRVRNIEEVAFKIQELVPEAVVAHAHGQMSERELENIMINFIEGEIDVLVCTTIIETGLDIPNVNTIIIQDADHMGLSQLYQLRGRVGRSNRSSYAYLTTKRDKVLTEVSEKRLQTVREFTEFGSGFKVAMRDLEIRGSGNLLGAEQHGHMESIGYDTYCKLLEEAVNELKGIPTKERIETTIDLNINAYIPPYFISNEEQKLEIYKKISFIQNEEDYFNVQEEIEDRFGTLPSPVQNLIDVALLKAVANKIGVVTISQKHKNIVISFKTDANISIDKLKDLMSKNKNKLMFTTAQNPYITYKIEDALNIKHIIDVKNLLSLL